MSHRNTRQGPWSANGEPVGFETLHTYIGTCSSCHYCYESALATSHIGQAQRTLFESKVNTLFQPIAQSVHTNDPDAYLLVCVDGITVSLSLSSLAPGQLVSCCDWQQTRVSILSKSGLLGGGLIRGHRQCNHDHVKGASCPCQRVVIGAFNVALHALLTELML